MVVVVVVRTHRRNCEGKPQGQVMAKGLGEAWDRHRYPAVGSRRMGRYWLPSSKSSPVLGPLRLEYGPTTYLLLLEASRHRSGGWVS